jgi:hypothetical protein
VDWFEQIFHVDPDHGNGMFELAILLFLVIAISMTIVRFRGRAARKSAKGGDRH